MGRILRSGGLLYFVILIVLAVVLVNMLSRGNPDVAELNSQQWNQAVQNKTFDTSLDKTNENYLTIYDEDQTVRGQLDTDSGDPKEFEYSYTQMTDVASQLDKADVPYSVDPQNTGFWLTLLGTLWFASLGSGGWPLVFAFIGVLMEWPGPVRHGLHAPDGTRRALARVAGGVLRVVGAGAILWWWVG